MITYLQKGCCEAFRLRAVGRNDLCTVFSGIHHMQACSLHVLDPVFCVFHYASPLRILPSNVTSSFLFYITWRMCSMSQSASMPL